MSKWIPAWAKSYRISLECNAHDEWLVVEFSGNVLIGGFTPISGLAKELAIADVCQQIRNKPLPKQERYKSDPTDAEDYIDKTYKSMPWQEFVGAIKWTIGKYFDRFGKKDDILKEAIKIEDYAIRFRQKVELEIAKQNKINEVV